MGAGLQLQRFSYYHHDGELGGEHGTDHGNKQADMVLEK